MLGVGVQASEAADGARAAPSRQLPQLLGQPGELWRQSRQGQLGGAEVMVVHQLPAALQTLGSERESKQEALYRRAKVGNWTERQSQRQGV